MTQFVRAHGYLPGPTQRPVAAGLLAGVIGTLAAAPMLWLSHALAAMAQSLRVNAWLIVALGVVYLAIAGAFYGRILMRAANDRRGGWLFGICFGFVLWMLGPIPIVQWYANAPMIVGRAAAGLFAAHLLYGLALGILFPHVHSLIQRRRW